MLSNLTLEIAYIIDHSSINFSLRAHESMILKFRIFVSKKTHDENMEEIKGRNIF